MHRRLCSACQDRPSTSYGRYCRECASEATRRWRADPEKREAERFRRRARDASLPSREQRANVARSYVAEYVKRGLLAREPCELCGRRATAFIPNPDQLRRQDGSFNVRWLCRDHRSEADAPANQADPLRDLADDVRAIAQAFVTLPADEQRRLHERAMQGLGVKRVGDTFYWYWVGRALAERQGPEPLY